mmetsp:Transcript_7325/g.15500  ORF Transcript_7325/g.15500 Transcript_7325/m.15500 type:complete len:259 (+) Transcript_7325:326-1102(+)
MLFCKLGPFRSVHGRLLLLPVSWGQDRGIFSNLRVRALVRVGVVHPLGEKPSVQGHLTVVLLGDEVQLLLQCGRDLAWSVDVGRRHVHHEVQQAMGRGGRSQHLSLQLVHQPFALVQAADGVVGGRCDAVRRTSHVVGNANMQVARAGLLQSPDLSKVLPGLREVVLRILRLGVEAAQGHQAIALQVQFHELALHLLTLQVLPFAIISCKPFYDDHCILERKCRRGQKRVPDVFVGELEIRHCILFKLHEQWPVPSNL